MTSPKSPIGYVELPSYEVIDMVATALANVSDEIDGEIEWRKKRAIEMFKRRLFQKDRTDEECYQEYCDEYLIDESIEVFVKWRFSDICNTMKKVLRSAKSTDKILLSIETHNTILGWVENDH